VSSSVLSSSCCACTKRGSAHFVTVGNVPLRACPAPLRARDSCFHVAPIRVMRTLRMPLTAQAAHFVLNRVFRAIENDNHKPSRPYSLSDLTSHMCTYLHRQWDGSSRRRGAAHGRRRKEAV
jgi:hypothetical protein